MTILLICLVIGNIIKSFIDFPIPGTVIGMGILFLALVLGIVKVPQVDETSSVLIESLGFLVCPASVGIINVLGDIKGDMINILIVITVSTIITFIVSAKTVDFFQRRVINDK